MAHTAVHTAAVARREAYLDAVNELKIRKVTAATEQIGIGQQATTLSLFQNLPAFQAFQAAAGASLLQESQTKRTESLSALEQISARLGLQKLTIVLPMAALFIFLLGMFALRFQAARG